MSPASGWCSAVPRGLGERTGRLSQARRRLAPRTVCHCAGASAVAESGSARRIILGPRAQDGAVHHQDPLHLGIPTERTVSPPEGSGRLLLDQLGPLDDADEDLAQPGEDRRRRGVLAGDHASRHFVQPLLAHLHGGKWRQSNGIEDGFPAVHPVVLQQSTSHIGPTDTFFPHRVDSM